MNISPRLAALCALPILAVLGCGGTDTPPAPTAPATPKEGPAPVAPGDWKRKELGKGVWLETSGQRRRVRVDAAVCLREGQYGLECLLCKENTKEYESILHTPGNAQLIHAGLIACGAEPGHPVRFDPAFQPPAGSVIKVTLEYEDKGQLLSVPAQYWVKNQGKNAAMTDDWVFAGSMLWKDPDDEDGKTKPRIYAAASDGAYIVVTNVPTAMLDLAIPSKRKPEERTFAPFTEHIPPLETKVSVVLEPAAPGKVPAGDGAGE